LTIAAIKGFSELVRILLDASADPSVRNKNGETALMLAQKGAFRNVIEVLKAAGVRD
jgi:ankyrin repeat protein